MNEIAKSKKMAMDITNPEAKFEGFTLEEIRYRRALVAMQKEFCSNKIERSLFNLQKINPLSPTSTADSLPGKAGAIALKLLKGLNYLDYAVLGFSLFNSVRKLTSFFHRKKK